MSVYVQGLIIPLLTPLSSSSEREEPQPTKAASATMHKATEDFATTSAALNESTNLVNTIDTVINRKKENMQRALDDKWVRYHPGMIAGDALTTGYTLFTGIQYLNPILQSLAWVSWSTCICGEIGGLINIWVALQEYQQAFIATENNDILNKTKMIA